MCLWGNTVLVTLQDGKKVDVDSCISGIVQALNNGGVKTIASCCGHGNSPGNIILEDGRELIIFPDYESSRDFEKSYPDINGQRRWTKSPWDKSWALDAQNETTQQTVKRLSDFMMGNAAMSGCIISKQVKLEVEQDIRKQLEAKKE